MAIYKEIFRTAGSNSAEISANLDWDSALRVRMTDAQMEKWGACNVLRLANSSGADIILSWTWDVNRTDSIIVKANSIHNVTIDDGKNFYGFDIYSNHATTVCAANEIRYFMSKVIQQPEKNNGI